MASSAQSAALKREIEAKLASRIPAALSPQAQQAPRLMASGVSEIDGLLGGGFIFLSIEDETGIANAIIDPDLYERFRSLVTYAKFLLVEGALQNVDNVIHVRAKHVEELTVTAAPMQSHDFH